MEVLKLPYRKTKSHKCRNAIKDELSCLFARGAFEYVDNQQRSTSANILCRRFDISSKQPVAELEKHKARSIVKAYT